MKNAELKGLTIQSVTEENGYCQLTMSNGAIVIGKIAAILLDAVGTTAPEKPVAAKAEPKKVEKKEEPKKVEKKAPKKPTLEDLEDMDAEELADVIEEHDLDIDPKDYKKDLEGLLGAVAEEFGYEIEDDDDDDAPAAKGKPAAKAAPKKDEDDDDDEDLSWEDIKSMDEDDLAELIDDEELAVDPDDFEDDIKGLRTAVAKALKISIPKK
jgi:hypothetical protein